MSFTFVNCQGANSSSASSLATTPTWSANAGDTIVAVVGVNNSLTLTSVSDGTNTFTTQAVVSSAGSKLYIAYLLSLPASNASYAVTANVSGGPNEISLSAAGFTPPGGTVVSLDQTNTATGNATNITMNLTSVTVGALVIGGLVHDGTAVMTVGSGFVLPTNGQEPSNGDTSTHTPMFLQYLLNAAGGTQVVAIGNGTNAGSWALRGTSFKATSTGATGPSLIGYGVGI
jgi:hypothetical protein